MEILILMLIIFFCVVAMAISSGLQAAAREASAMGS
jgi:hypothetical protein